jgi:hypothetical protein
MYAVPYESGVDVSYFDYDNQAADERDDVS